MSESPIKRVNYQVGVWKRASENFPDVLSPIGHGFEVDKNNNMLDPLWFEGDVIPQGLLDTLANEGTTTEEKEVNISNEIQVNVCDDDED